MVNRRRATRQAEEKKGVLQAPTHPIVRFGLLFDLGVSSAKVHHSPI